MEMKKHYWSKYDFHSCSISAVNTIPICVLTLHRSTPSLQYYCISCTRKAITPSKSQHRQTTSLRIRRIASKQLYDKQQPLTALSTKWTTRNLNKYSRTLSTHKIKPAVAAVLLQYPLPCTACHEWSKCSVLVLCSRLVIWLRLIQCCRRSRTLSLYHSCDSTTIRQYHDAIDYDGSDQNCDLHSIRLRYDYNKKLTCSFFACVELCRMEAGACDTL